MAEHRGKGIVPRNSIIRTTLNLGDGEAAQRKARTQVKVAKCLDTFFDRNCIVKLKVNSDHKIGKPYPLPYGFKVQNET